MIKYNSRSIVRFSAFTASEADIEQKIIKEIKMAKIKEAFSQFIDWLMQTGIRSGVKVIIALIVLLVSFRLVTVLTRKIEKKMVGGKRRVDKTIATTLMYVVKIALRTVIVVSLVGYLGIDTSGITALIASLGVCIGLAVNGAVANFAGGVLLIFTRPFKVDDYIEACGHSGTVEDIHLINTRIRTTDNKIIYIPNGELSSSAIINYSEKDVRRVEITFAIGYSADFEKAKKIILDICNSHEKVLTEPAAPFARVSGHGESSINIVTRVWTKSSDFWAVKFDLLEGVKTAFDREGIEIPFNQLDVHIKND